MLDENKMYQLMSKNIAYYEYDTLEDRITILFHSDYIIKDQTIEEAFDGDEFVVEKDSRGDLINFFTLVKGNFSKQQLAFKALHDGISRWYLISSFERNEEDRIVCGIFENISSFLIEQDKLLELSKRDSLTGLLNKVNLEKYIDNCIKERGFFMLCMIDLDYFKTINDTYGHIYGDRVLVAAAEKLKAIAGEDGEVGRVGGDEFILIKRIDHQPVDEEKRNLCRAIKNSFYDDKNNNLYTSRLTTTIGYATYPFDGKTKTDLLARADKALYRGKAKGRNCYVIYNEQMHGAIDVDKPIQDTVMEDFASTADISIFISDIMGGILNNPTKEKALSKLVDIMAYFRLQRITIYKRDGSTIQKVYKMVQSEKEYGELSVLDFKSFNDQFEGGIFIASDIFEYKYDRKAMSACMNIPYDHGSIVISACGLIRATDYLMCFEAFDRRRIWNKNQLTAIKVLSRMIITFYQNAINKENNKK